MVDVDLKKLHKAMEEALSPKRYDHTLGVEYTAACMAMRFGVDVNKARIAGLLHDCAKCISDEKRIKICREHGHAVTEMELKNPSLLHALAGRILAEEKYDIDDEDILMSIESHTTGRPGMIDLEKIIFIADYIEPGRKQIPGLEDVRRLAFVDLDDALRLCFKNILDYLNSTSDEISPMTEISYNYYLQQGD